jgi:hypothetical protein
MPTFRNPSEPQGHKFEQPSISPRKGVTERTS